MAEGCFKSAQYAETPALDADPTPPAKSLAASRDSSDSECDSYYPPEPLPWNQKPSTSMDETVALGSWLGDTSSHASKEQSSWTADLKLGNLTRCSLGDSF
jgi:hypothetical protein